MGNASEATSVSWRVKPRAMSPLRPVTNVAGFDSPPGLY